MDDEYEVMARFYDGAYADNPTFGRDVAFYVAAARDAGGPVLEVACGTGRILLPTARAGVSICGLDGSPAMLGILRLKLQQESPEAQARVGTLLEADMRGFDLGETFALVTMPFRPFQHLPTLDDQLAALLAVRRHLRDEGHFLFDVFYPNWSMLQGPSEEILDMEWADPDREGVTLRRYFKRTGVHRNEQRFEGVFTFRAYRGERCIEEVENPLSMNYYTYPHLRLLFRQTGLRVIAEYGGFDKSAIADGKEMIFVLGKA